MPDFKNYYAVPVLSSGHLWWLICERGLLTGVSELVSVTG